MRLSLILVPLLGLLLAACSEPTPDPDEPLEPQATAAAPTGTELRDAINEPLDKAKAVEATQAEESAERDQALETGD